jgi:hypothetical protein
MPTYRITETATGEQMTVREPTDWDAWMHFRFMRRIAGGGTPMPFDAKMRVTGTPARHDYTVEQIDPDTGTIVEGTYLTIFRSVDATGS